MGSVPPLALPTKLRLVLNKVGLGQECDSELIASGVKGSSESKGQANEQVQSGQCHTIDGEMVGEESML